MDIIENYESCHLHLALRELLDKKSKRDGRTFTIYQLANVINMPKSMLIRIMHTDPTKRVNNPRIDTLMKIVDFFKKDGFNISIDELLYGKNGKTVAVHDIESQKQLITVSVPLLSSDLTEQKGFITLKIPSSSETIIAFHLEDDIKPIFSKGSLFIVDRCLHAENDNLVLIKNGDYLYIRKYFKDSGDTYFLPLSQDEKIYCKSLSKELEIVGVIIQVNISTGQRDCN